MSYVLYVLFFLQDVIAIRRVLLAQHSAFPVRGCDMYDAAVLSTALLSTASDQYDTVSSFC